MPERRLSRGFLFTSAVVLRSASLVGQTTVVRAARMLDVASGEIRKPGVVVIEGDRIRGVNPTTVRPDATVIEFGDATLLPGLMEAGVADGPDEVVKAIRYPIKHGSKGIKMCATAWIFSFEGPVGAQQYSEAELRVGVEEASRQRIRVAVHAHGTEGIMASLHAGVASIEHEMLTPEAIALMKERGVWLVPQAYLMEGGGIDLASLEHAVRRKLAEIGPRAKSSYEQAIRAGVKIAFSTDGPAQLLEVEDRGRLAPGLLADVVAVRGDPTQHTEAMQDVQL